MGRGRASGVSFEEDEGHLYKIRDGKIAELREYHRNERSKPRASRSSAGPGVEAAMNSPGRPVQSPGPSVQSPPPSAAGTRSHKRLPRAPDCASVSRVSAPQSRNRPRAGRAAARPADGGIAGEIPSRGRRLDSRSHSKPLSPRTTCPSSTSDGKPQARVPQPAVRPRTDAVARARSRHLCRREGGHELDFRDPLRGSRTAPSRAFSADTVA
jgi:hypothetical protein